MPTPIGLGQTPMIQGIVPYGAGSVGVVRSTPRMRSGLSGLSDLSGPKAKKPSAGATAVAGTLAGAATPVVAALVTGTAVSATSAGAGGAAAVAIAGATSLSVPVAGWIVGGGLLVAAGVVTLVSMFRTKGRKKALEEAAKMGEGGKAFAREYVRLSTKKPETVKRIAEDYERKIAKKKAGKRKDVLVDKFNAALAVLGSQLTSAAVPLVKNEPQTTPIVVEERGALGDAVNAVTTDWRIAAGLGLGVLVVGGGVFAYTRRGRR